MDTKDIILELRTKKGLSQDELAEKVFVTRQAVSRWENGETIPNTETLKLLSELFCVSINTLLGSPRKLVCECCGMPIDDANISHEKDGALNENYCGWCYADGEYTLDFFEKYKEFGSVRQPLDIPCRSERAGPAAHGNPDCPNAVRRWYHRSAESCRFTGLDPAYEQHHRQSGGNHPGGADLQ